MIRSTAPRAGVWSVACVALGAVTSAYAEAVPAASDQQSWSSLTVLVLATFVGLGVIGRVSRLLHTPLMSLTNAISAISVVGSILIAGSDYPPIIRALGAVALFASMTNIVSGFLITERMIRMFKERGESNKGGAK
jgi:H+-translocating NAD(P) transhydrogenase subunit alpha